MRTAAFVLLALVIGFVSGRLSQPRGSSGDPTSEKGDSSLGNRPAATSLPRNPTEKRPVAPPISGDPTRQFFPWLRQVDANNWQESLDALFEDRESAFAFFFSKSPQALSFVERLGAVGGSEAAERLRELGLSDFIPGLVAGWAAEHPREAYEYAMSLNLDNTLSRPAISYAMAELSLCRSRPALRSISFTRPHSIEQPRPPGSLPGAGSYPWP